ncbi:MAG TPA: redoxin family protein [Fimbriimonadaceae bacterium]|nr:redoxin family protein [Fimbriimonadaceae bacterium]
MFALIALAVSLGSPIPAAGWVTALDGTRHRPLVEEKGKTLALVFITHDCPICNAYAPELRRIADSYAKKGASVELVYAEPNLTLAEAKSHAKAYSYTGLKTFLDPTAILAKASGVTVTPEAAVYGANGSLLYRGRIDDQYVAFGKQRARVTSHDLRIALDAALRHHPLAHPRTEAVGCFIPLTRS